MSRAEERRSRLLEAMLEVVGERGYANASVSLLLERTGLYRQAFYDDFLDKEDCFLQAYDHAARQLEGIVSAAAAEADDWRGRLRRGLAAALGFLDRRPDIGRALVVEVHAAGPRAVAKRDRAMARVAGFLGQGGAEASDGASPPRLAPEAIAAGIHAVLHARLAARDDGAYSRLLPEFMYIAVLPYFGLEAAAAELRERAA